MAAPLGNTNATKTKPWIAALERAVIQDPNKLREIALKVLDMAANGDMAAIRELVDRLDGKPTQQIDSNVNVTGIMAKELSTVALEAIARGMPVEEAAQLH